MERDTEWIRKLQETTGVPEAVSQKAEQAFSMIRQEAGQNGGMQEEKRNKDKKRKWNRRKMAVLILAAALGISTLSVGAAAYFHWNNRFSKQYQVSPEMEKQLNDSNAAKEINQAVEHDGIKIEAVQTVADNQYAHIILKIYGSEGFTLNDHMNFGNVDVKVEGNDHVSVTAGYLEGMSDEDFANGIEYEIILHTLEEEGTLNREVKISFEDIIDSYTGKLNMTEAPTLIEAAWELSIKLDNEDSGMVYEVGRQIPGSEAVVKQIRISSISFDVLFDWNYQTEMLPYTDENGEEGTFEHMVSPPELCGFVYEDGSVYGEAYVQGGRFTNQEKTQYQLEGSYFGIPDYENVSELIFLLDGEKVRVPVVTQGKDK